MRWSDPLTYKVVNPYGIIPSIPGLYAQHEYTLKTKQTSKKITSMTKSRMMTHLSLIHLERRF